MARNSSLVKLEADTFTATVALWFESRFLRDWAAQVRDIDVRCAVRAHLQALHKDDHSTMIVEEMGIWSGTVRVDLAVINGELAGIELKSARDTLARLPMQASLYNMIFDRVTLVLASKHALEAESLVPKWWGLTLAEPQNEGLLLRPIRPSKKNRSQDAVQLARLLWRDECVSILARRDAIKGFRSANCDRLWDRLAAFVPFDELKNEVREALKGRSDWLRKPIAS